MLRKCSKMDKYEQNYKDANTLFIHALKSRPAVNKAQRLNFIRILSCCDRLKLHIVLTKNT